MLEKTTGQKSALAVDAICERERPLSMAVSVMTRSVLGQHPIDWLSRNLVMLLVIDNFTFDILSLPSSSLLSYRRTLKSIVNRTKALTRFVHVDAAYADAVACN
jgi:hypothetical protein